MEEKTQENQTINQKEIKLLTFQPQQMLDEIAKLKDEVLSLKIEQNTLKMLLIDLQDEINKLRRRSLKSRFQEILLRLLGGQWEETK